MHNPLLLETPQGITQLLSPMRCSIQLVLNDSHIAVWGKTSYLITLLKQAASLQFKAADSNKENPFHVPYGNLNQVNIINNPLVLECLPMCHFPLVNNEYLASPLKLTIRESIIVMSMIRLIKHKAILCFFGFLFNPLWSGFYTLWMKSLYR